MLTNLIASAVITLVTNVFPSDNAVYEPDYSIAYATYPAQFGQRVKTPATEKYLTTNIVEHSEITVQIHGRSKVFYDDRTISSVTAILRKLEDWKPAGIRTNEILQLTNASIVFTNWTTPFYLGTNR